MVGGISGALHSIFGDSIPKTQRASKWGPLAITEKIRSKISKFEKQSVVVERTVNSFERFFKQVEKVEQINKDRSKTDANCWFPTIPTEFADQFFMHKKNNCSIEGCHCLNHFSRYVLSFSAFAPDLYSSSAVIVSSVCQSK